MRILYLISYAGKAGTEKYVLELMRLYAARGHECLLAFSEPGELSRTAAGEGFETLRLDLSASRALSAARRLARFCRSRAVDVIHAQYPRENVIAVLSRLFRRETRVVFTSHLTIDQGRKWKTVNRIITPGDAAVISVCRQGAEILRRNGVCPDRIRVICNGVPAGPRPEKQNVIREEYGLPSDCFIFISLARYVPEKGLFTLLDAAALLREMTALPFTVLIAGDGVEYEAVGRRIEELGLEKTVIRAGYRTDTEALLRSADAYVSSALCNEAMSFSILEAMACGLPLAVTDVGAGADLAEGCGFVSRPGDPAGLAESMAALLTRPEERSALGDAAYKRSVEEFDLEKQADALFTLYEK